MKLPKINIFNSLYGRLNIVIEESFQESGLMNGSVSSFGVEAVVTMDSKGQIVLPKGLRVRAGFKPNEKIGLISFEKEGEVCCIIMIKAESLGAAVIETLSQIAQGLR